MIGKWTSAGLLAMAFCLIILVLSACSLSRLGPTVRVPDGTPTAIYQLGNAYGILQSGAIAYASLPVCPPGTNINLTSICRDKGVTAKIATADEAFLNLYVPLTEWVRDPEHRRLNVLEMIEAARGALHALRTTMDLYNVGALQ